jgi:hypothetical protein
MIVAGDAVAGGLRADVDAGVVFDDVVSAEKTNLS